MFNILFMIMKILMAIPFLTLFERKILSYSQNRKGPNKVSLLGLLQPVSDGMKLMIKYFVVVSKSKKHIFFVLPLFSFLSMVLCWKFYPYFFSSYNTKFSILMMLCISSLTVYFLLFSGWASNSKYSTLGSIRGAAQNISYEMSLMMVILVPCCFKFSLNLFVFLKNNFFLFILMPLLFLVWLTNCIAELKRAPFDFAEGESELVSGFKTEYSSLNFALFFLGEYGMILFLSFLSSMLFFLKNFFLKIFFGLVFTFFFVLMRASYPRFRYDFLMKLAWKIFLPLGMLFLKFMLLMK